MSGTISDFASAVESVIRVCRDAEQGFRAAADAVKDPALKSTFEQYSEQRAGFARQLQNTVESLGFNATHPSGLTGTLHGAWMTLKAALTGHSDHAILEETERGEDLSLKTYREALAQNLSSEIRSVIEPQYQQVLAAHQRIRSLRDSSASAPAAGPPPRP